jgi:hypothetical protein
LVRESFEDDTVLPASKLDVRDVTRDLFFHDLSESSASLNAKYRRLASLIFAKGTPLSSTNAVGYVSKCISHEADPAIGCAFSCERQRPNP